MATFGVLHSTMVAMLMLGSWNSIRTISVMNVAAANVVGVYLSVAYLNDFIMFLRNTIKTTKPEGKMSSGYFIPY